MGYGVGQPQLPAARACASMGWWSQEQQLAGTKSRALRSKRVRDMQEQLVAQGWSQCTESVGVPLE